MSPCKKKLDELCSTDLDANLVSLFVDRLVRESIADFHQNVSTLRCATTFSFNILSSCCVILYYYVTIVTQKFSYITCF